MLIRLFFRVSMEEHHHQSTMTENFFVRSYLVVKYVENFIKCDKNIRCTLKNIKT